MGQYHLDQSAISGSLRTSLHLGLVGLVLVILLDDLLLRLLVVNRVGTRCV